MSWAEIKKAVNSDLNKALNTLITEKHSTTDALVTSLKTGGAVPIVKSVQRGHSSSLTNQTSSAGVTVSLNTINPAKSIAIINFDTTSGSSADTSGYSSSWVEYCYNYSLSANSLTIPAQGTNYTGYQYYYNTPATCWQVIEFY